MKALDTRPISSPSDLAKQESFILKDDLKGLTGAEKTKFYIDLCNYIGLSPITKPFGIYEFQGKEVLYIKADAFDQLCAKNKVSRRILSQDVVTQAGIIKQDFIIMGEGNEQAYLVKVEASRMIDGEKVLAEDVSVVPVLEEQFKWVGGSRQSQGYKKNFNSLMKAITKAYRRAAKKLISLGSVILEDDIEDQASVRDLNLETGDVVGGKNEGDILDIALPTAWRGFKTLKEIDMIDAALLDTLEKELIKSKETKGLSEGWKTVLERIDQHLTKVEREMFEKGK